MQLTVESVSKNEVLRFLNVLPGTVISSDMDALIDRCLAETLRIIRPVGIFHPYRFERTEAGLRLVDGGLTLGGGSIQRFLFEAADTVCMMAVTVGAGMDRTTDRKSVV